MADDYGKATAAPSHVVLGGASYRVAKQGPRVYGELSQFLKSFIPDPRIQGKEIIRGLPDDLAWKIWQGYIEEARGWPPTLDSFEGNRILTTTHEGATAVVWALLRKHTPGLTPEKAREIADDITAEEIAEMIHLSMPEPAFDPKSRPDPTTEDRGPVPA